MTCLDTQWITTPKDFELPNWEDTSRTNEWKNYISEELVSFWPTLSSELRAALARQAEAIAMQEEWD